jgi:hypothetical protein
VTDIQPPGAGLGADPLPSRRPTGYRRCPEIGVSVSVLGIALAMALALGGVPYLRGRTLDPSERFFLEAGRPPSGGEGAMAACMEYALFSNEANDVIFVGDSACWNAVDPIRLRRLTGLQAYNLSLPGIGAHSCPLTVRGYLARHPKPKAVVLCLSPLGLEIDSGPWANALHRLHIYYGLELGGVPLSESVAYLVRSGVRRLVGFPDYRGVQLGGVPGPLTYFTQQPAIVAARGFYGRRGRSPLQISPGKNGVLIREDWDRGIHEVADLCDAAGVRLLILFAPLESQYQTARDFGRLDRWGRELEQTHRALKLQRPLIVPYEQNLMNDAIHVNIAGAEKFAPIVAKAVQQVLAN